MNWSRKKDAAKSGSDSAARGETDEIIDEIIDNSTNEEVTLLARILKAAPAILIAVLLTAFLSRSGFLRQLETAALDTQMRLRGAPEESDIAIVTIDDADYAKLFHKKSPLDRKALIELLNAIALGKPKVIGIDLDTSAKEFGELQVNPQWPMTIWARNGAYSSIEGRFRLDDVLGNENSAVNSGLVTLKADPDRSVRLYTRVVETQQGDFPTLPFSLAKAFLPDRSYPNKALHDELLIGFAGDNRGSHRQHFTASRVLELADGQGWQTDSPIRDKIVLVGGTYSASDEHETPLGWMYSVEVLAYVTETELRGGGTRPAGFVLVVLLGGLVGLIILLLFQHFSSTKALLLSTLAIPIVAVGASLIAFRSIAFWGYFVTVPLAVLVQELYGYAKDYRKHLVTRLYESAVKKGTPSRIAPAAPSAGDERTRKNDINESSNQR